jgi:hypothetical protein
MDVQVDEVAHFSICLRGGGNGYWQTMSLVLQLIYPDYKWTSQEVTPQDVGSRFNSGPYILRTRTIVLVQARSIIPQLAAI